jgi:hypothetical protein
VPPDITGQPAWVVIVIMVLTVSASIGVAYLANRNRKQATDDKGEQDALPSGVNSPTVLVMRAALDHLARVADREAGESEEARKEAAALRTRLEEQLHEMVNIQAKLTEALTALARCQAHAEILSEQAFRKGHHD